MDNIGQIYTFAGENYELLEDNIIPEKKKRRFVVLLNLSMFVLIAICLVPHNIVFRNVTGGTIDLTDLLLVMLSLLGYLVFIVIHELLHGMAFHVFGNVPRKHIKFGVVWQSGMAFCISQIPVPVKGGRISLMMPVYAVCIPLYIVAVVTSNYWLGVYAILLFSGSVGDIYYMWKLRKTDKNLYMYERMPTKSGYEIGYLLFKKL